MPRFSANLSLLFNEVPLDERFRAAAAAGFSAVEIQFPYVMEADSILRLLEEHRLRLVLFNVAADMLLEGGEGLASVPEKQAQFRVAVEQAADYARTLKPEAINVLPGRCLDSERLPEYRTALKCNLQYAADVFAGLGVKTLIEAINTHDMPGFIMRNESQMLEMLEEVNHPNLALQYDIYHMRRMGEDCAAFLRLHADKIGHIQFADCPGRAQPGTGEIDFATLFTLIDRSDYRGWVGAEYKPSGDTLSSLDWFRVYRNGEL